MIDYINEKVQIVPQGKHFFKDVPKKELADLLYYLYHYYSPNSIYVGMMPSERKEEILKTTSLDLEKHKAFVKSYEEVTMSPTEKLAMAINERIEKIMLEVRTSEVDIKDLEKEGKNLKALTEIFKLQDLLSDRLSKENRQVEGKGAKAIGYFENIIL